MEGNSTSPPMEDSGGPSPALSERKRASEVSSDGSAASRRSRASSNRGRSDSTRRRRESSQREQRRRRRERRSRRRGSSSQDARSRAAGAGTLHEGQVEVGQLWIGECNGGMVRQGLCFPVSASALKFMVRSQQLTAELSLLITLERNSDVYKILLKNRDHSTISESRTVYNEAATPELLSTEEWREFWVTWHGGRVRVGRGGDPVPFLNAKLPDRPKFKYVMPGDGVHWKLELGPVQPHRSRAVLTGAEVAWVAAQDGRPPLGAVIGGYEEEPLTVIRAPHLGSLTPGKFVPSQGAYIGRDWIMHPKENFQALVGYTAEWVASSGGAVPGYALPGGYAEESHETLYVARASHEGHLALGKVHPSHGCAYITHSGKEVRKNNYQVLVCRVHKNSRAVRVQGSLTRLAAVNYYEPEHDPDYEPDEEAEEEESEGEPVEEAEEEEESEGEPVEEPEEESEEEP